MTSAQTAGAAPDAALEHAPGRWRALALLAVAEFLGMSLWFAASAAAPQLRERWHLDTAQVGALTQMVQLGFVAGTAVAALLNLADIWQARSYFAGAAVLASASNLALLVVPGFASALVARFAVGFFLAGVYPPGMKMAATWFRRGRGLAIGIVVGALATGKALPYVAHAIGTASVTAVVGVTSAAAILAAVLIATLYHDGPFPFERRPFSWGLVGAVLRDRDARLAIGGYLGHMWELYAMWAWIPAFLAASFAHGAAVSESTRRAADLIAFATFAAGGLGCVWGGWAAARIGYARVVTISMAVSGVCSLGIGLLFGASPWLLVPAMLVWGFFVVADSAQFSAMVTEAAPPHAVGTALTLQTSMGFLLTMATIQLVPVLAESWGWSRAFPVLALGPALGIAAIAALRRSR